MSVRNTNIRDGVEVGTPKRRQKLKPIDYSLPTSDKQKGHKTDWEFVVGLLIFTMHGWIPLIIGICYAVRWLMEYFKGALISLFGGF